MLETVLALVALLLIPPIVVVLYVARTVRRTPRTGTLLDVEVHPAEPARGTALRFVLRAPADHERVRVQSITVDGSLARDLDLSPPEGFFEPAATDDTPSDDDPDLDEVGQSLDGRAFAEEEIEALLDRHTFRQRAAWQALCAQDDQVTWLGALDVDRRGMELRIPGRSDPTARGPVAFEVRVDLGVSELHSGVLVTWPDDLHH